MSRLDDCLVRMRVFDVYGMTADTGVPGNFQNAGQHLEVYQVSFQGGSGSRPKLFARKYDRPGHNAVLAHPCGTTTPSGALIHAGDADSLSSWRGPMRPTPSRRTVSARHCDRRGSALWPPAYRKSTGNCHDECAGGPTARRKSLRHSAKTRVRLEIKRPCGSELPPNEWTPRIKA